MKRLFIMRHAKAEPDALSKRDIDRALNDRGRRAADEIGQYFREQAYACGTVQCSAAARTRETFGRLQPYVGDMVPVQFREELYLAEASAMLAIVRLLDDKIPSAMFVGHNPGVAELALSLSAAPKDLRQEKRHRRMREKFSTGSLAVIDFEVQHWGDVLPGQGTLTDFVRPRDLD